MSKIKLQSDLFLESEELERLVKFIGLEGYLRILTNLITKYGFFKDEDNDDVNFKVYVGTQAETIKIPIDSYALNIDGNIIVCRAFDNLAIPSTTGNEAWDLIVSYKETVYEVGTVVVDSSGNMIGTGTAFTEILRGLPNFPSRILVVPDGQPASAGRQIEVISVTSDTEAVVQGELDGLAVLNTFIVLGTFTEDSIYSIDLADQYLYGLDSCELELRAGSVGSSPALSKDREFRVAQMTNGHSEVLITDFRNSHLLTFGRVNDDEYTAKLNRQNIFEKHNVPSNDILNIDSATIVDYLEIGDNDNVIVNITGSTEGLLIKGFKGTNGVTLPDGTEINIQFNNVYPVLFGLYNSYSGGDYFLSWPHISDLSGIQIGGGDSFRAILDKSGGGEAWVIRSMYTKTAVLQAENTFEKPATFGDNVYIEKLLGTSWLDESGTYSFDTISGLITLSGNSNNVFIDNFAPTNLIVGVTNIRRGTIMRLRVNSVSNIPIFATTLSSPATKLIGIDNYIDGIQSDPNHLPFEIVIRDTGVDNEWEVVHADFFINDRLKELEDRLNNAATDPGWVSPSLNVGYSNNPTNPFKWRINNAGMLELKGEFIWDSNISPPTSTACILPVTSPTGAVFQYGESSTMAVCFISSAGAVHPAGSWNEVVYNKFSIALSGFTYTP